jgi:hypothetical protein
MNHDSPRRLRTAQAPAVRGTEKDSNNGVPVKIQAGDWVRTDKGEICKIASVDASSRTAALLKLDQDNLRITSVIFPIDRLAKVEIER